MQNPKSWLSFGIILILIILLFVSIWIGYKKVASRTESRISLTFIKPTPTPDPLSPKNILILGYGGGNHDGSLLTDTMMVAHIDPKSHEIVIISIPRDLWIPLPLLSNGFENEKINTAYANGFETHKYLDRPKEYKGDEGGSALAKYAATLVTGLPIDGYVAVSFSGFKNALTMLGPVTVTVPYTFEDIYYPLEGKEKDTCGKTQEDIALISATESGDLLERQYSCRYESIKFEKGVQDMDAETALKFVRSRHSETNPGDFYRSLRQLALIQGVIAKLKTIGGVIKLPALVTQISKVVTTDISPTQVMELGALYGDPLSFHVGRISLTEDNVLVASTSSDRQYILAPKEGNEFDSVKQYIAREITRLTAAPSATPTSQ